MKFLKFLKFQSWGSAIGDPRGQLRGRLFQKRPQIRIRGEKLLLTCNFELSRGSFKNRLF